MALPLPRVVADVGPGGPLVTSMGGINSLANQNILRQINQIKKQYTPATTEAEIRSKNAYANLIGLQPAGKILANENAYGALNDAQRNEINRLFLSRGGIQSNLPFPNTNGNNGGNSLNQMPQTTGSGQPHTNNFSGYMKNAIKNVFSALGGNDQQQSNSQNALNNPQQGTSQPMSQQQPSVQQGESQQSVPQGGEPQIGDTVTEPDDDPEFTRAFKDWQFSPEGQRELKKGEKANIPGREEAVTRYNLKYGIPPIESTDIQPNKTNAEKIGEFQGVKEEGKELGKIRAKSIDDLDQQYQQAVQAEVPVDHLIDLTQNPEFKNILNTIPLFQDKQLKVLSNFGTPEQQKALGDFTTTATNAVANTVNSFKGRILDKEVTMANQMKITPKDTWNTMVGKLASIKTFNEMTKKRARLASELIQKEHLNRGEAIEKADKQLDGKAIRQKVEQKLNPISDEDINHTAKINGMTREQVIQRLKSEGRYNG